MLDNLLHPNPQPTLIHVELTTKCNLRCVYCAKSKNGGKDDPEVHFDPMLFQSLIDGLVAVGAKNVRISGFGETTTHPNWQTLSIQLIDAGFELEIVTNLAKRLAPSELETLARFKRILTSCDTTDPILFPALRRNVSFSRFAENVRGLAATAERLGATNNLELCMSIVVTDRVVFGLEKTIADGIDMGIREFFLNDLAMQEDVPGAITVRPAWTLPFDQLRKAKACLESAIRLGTDRGALVVCTPGLLDAFEQRLSGNAQQDTVIGHWSAPEPGANRTRYCHQVWTQTYIAADGTVRPCCVDTPRMGSVQTTPLQEILNGENYRAFKARHLSGDLPEICRTCALAEIIDTDDLRDKIAHLIRTRADIIGSHLPNWKGRRVLIYGAGGHTRKLFSETNIANAPLIGIVDRNSSLHGRMFFGLPIYPVSEIDKLAPDVIVISSLDFQDEIYAQLAGYLDRGIDVVRLYATS